jgi:hypothetical protein
LEEGAEVFWEFVESKIPPTMIKRVVKIII